MRKNYLRWSGVPYAGEMDPPDDPVTPLAGSWPLVYLKRDADGNFFNSKDTKLKFPLINPNSIDFYKELRTVQRTLRTLTTDQRKIGIYYGSGVPTKQWTPIIDRLVDSYGVGPTEAARILAAVQGAINDTMIIVWDLKYRWDVARPNQYDQTMKTLLCTPRFPAYPSGHATMSGCTEVILSYFFPKEATKLRKVADDDARSRLYAGVHFPSDNNEGLRLGRYIGEVIVKQLKEQDNSDSNPIDNSYRNFRDAKIFPEEYQQFIPFDFDNACISRVMDEKNASRKGDHNSDAPKPFIKI